jgi:hypothetical protein
LQFSEIAERYLMDVDPNKKPGGKRSKKDNSLKAKTLAHSDYPERYYAAKGKAKTGARARKFAGAAK